MVKVDEENLVTPVGDGRNSAQKMRDRLKAQAYLGEQNFLAENRRREERKKTKEKNDYPDDNWFSTEDETFVVATKQSNPQFPSSTFSQFSENENVVRNARRRRQQQQQQQQQQQRPENFFSQQYNNTNSKTTNKQVYFSPPQVLEDGQTPGTIL